MIAERVWQTKFWNVHQSSFSIPGMRRGRGNRKQLRPASPPKWQQSTLRENGEKPLHNCFPQPAQVCCIWLCSRVCAQESWRLFVSVSMVVRVCVCLCVYERSREGSGREREVKGGERQWDREERRQRRMSAKMQRAWESEREEWLFPWSG